MSSGGYHQGRHWGPQNFIRLWSLSALWIIVVCYRRQRLRKRFFIRAILIKGIFGKSLLRQFAMYKSKFVLTADFSPGSTWTKTREVSIVKWRGRSRDRGHLLHRTGSAGCCSKQKHALWRKLQPGSSFLRIIKCDWPVLWFRAVITNILFTFKPLVFRAIEWLLTLSDPRESVRPCS